MKLNLFGGGDPAKQFMEQHQRAAALSNSGKYKQALPLHEKCLTIAAQGNLVLTEEQLLTTWQNICTCHFQLDDYDATLRYCRGTISLLTEWIDAREPGKNTDAELRKNKSVGEWKELIPNGLKFGIRESFDAWPTLAYTYKIAGSACMYAKNLNQGLDYYKKAIAAYERLNEPNEAAEIWTYVANEFRQQEEWDKTERAAQNALELAKQGGSTSVQLAAGFLLVHTYIALGLYPEALGVMKWAIPLGTRIGDPKAASLAQTLEWIDEKIHTTALPALDAAPLAALIETKRAVQWPDIAGDVQLLSRIEQELARRAQTPRDGVIRSLPDVRDALKQFAEKHCGTQANGRQTWSLGAEDMDVFGKQGHRGKAVGIMLYLSRKPETFIRVTLDGGECQVSIMKAKKIAVSAEQFTTGYIGLEPKSIPARSDALLGFLDGLIAAGTLAKQEGRLVYVDGKK